MLAYSEQDGKPVWSAKLGRAGAPGWGGFAGVRAVPTVDGDLLFAMAQYGEIAAFETATGREVWRKQMTKDYGGKLPEWGFSESPLVDGEQVVFTPGGERGGIVALNKRTGALLWQSAGFTDEAQYSSLMPATIGGVPQYVQLTMASVVGGGDGWPGALADGAQGGDGGDSDALGAGRLRVRDIGLPDRLQPVPHHQDRGPVRAARSVQEPGGDEPPWRGDPHW
ncbi:MAG: PQQ-like beta-propeller repeat protein [Verrucomicrobia bacterium]|nr:PQQ-like beta-propeller repeat protein [Verrucomicrobiota bacterium]